MTKWKIKALKHEQNKLAYKIELFILHITHINTIIRSLMKLIFTNIEGGMFNHMFTYRINHRNSFLSRRKAHTPLSRGDRPLSNLHYSRWNTGFPLALKILGKRQCWRDSASEYGRKKLGCSWYIRRGSARRRHIKCQYQSWRLNPSVKVTLPMAPISASTGGRIAWHCPMTSTQKHGALERVSQLSTPHFNSL